MKSLDLKFLSSNLEYVVLQSDPKTGVVDGGWISGRFLGIPWHFNLNRVLHHQTFKLAQNT